MNKKTFIISLMVICACYTGHAGLFGGNEPQVAFPEIKTELKIQKAPVIAVMREKKQNFQVASSGNVALNYNEKNISNNKINYKSANRLVVNKPNLKYVMEGEEIVVPVAPVIASVPRKNIVRAVKTEPKKEKVAPVATASIDQVIMENELVLKQKELESIKLQIAQQEEKLKSLKSNVVLPTANENNKKEELVEVKEQVVLPYKLAKSVENPIVAKKRIEYPVDVKKEFEKVYMAENEYLTLLESDFESNDVADDGSLDPLNEAEFNDYFPDENVGAAPIFEEVNDFSLKSASKSGDNVIVENSELLKTLGEFSTESNAISSLDKKINILQMKVGFEEGGASVDSKNVELISSFASVVMNNPTNGVEIYISDQSLSDASSKKLMAKRLAIVSQVLRDQGIKEYQIKPVLSKRPYNSIVLKIVDLDLYKQKKSQKTDAFGNVIKEKAFRTIDW